MVERGKQCRQLVEPFTWESCAQKIYQAAFQMNKVRETIVGTGFYCSKEDASDRLAFLDIWLRNTKVIQPKRIVA